MCVLLVMISFSLNFVSKDMFIIFPRKLWLLILHTSIFPCFCCWLLCTLFSLSGFTPLGFPEKVFNEAEVEFS
jgi:hypothetical protein